METMKEQIEHETTLLVVEVDNNMFDLVDKNF